MGGTYHGFHKTPRAHWMRQKPLADLGGADSGGLSRLSQGMTINGVTVTPTFWYEGKNASASGFTATVGSDLAAAGSGGTFQDDVPMPSATDKAFDGEATRYFETADTSYGDVADEDMVIEVVAVMSPTSTSRVVRKVSTTGWDLAAVSGNRWRFNQFGASLTKNIDSATTLSIGCWYHVMLFSDADGSAQVYVNGDASGSAVDVSGTGSLTNAGTLTLPAISGGTYIYDRPIALVALWKQASWLDTHLQATIAQQRFAALTGVASTRYGYPVHASLRNSVAYMESQASSGGQRIFAVGPRWPRIETRPDATRRYGTGYRSEVTATNKLISTADPQGGDWTQTRVTVGDDDTNGPTRFADASTVSEDGTAASTHVVTQAVNVTAHTYLVSCYAKASNRAWIRLSLSSPTDGDESVYYDLSSVTLGTVTGTVRQGIRYLGQGWCHCWFTRTHATAEAGTFSFEVADADGSNSFDGLSQESVCFWGPMVVQDKGSPIAYIESGATPAAIASDKLRYTGLNLPPSFTLAIDLLADTSGAVSSYEMYGEVSDGGTSDRAVFYTQSGTAKFNLAAGGVTQAAISGGTSVQDNLWHEARATVIKDNVAYYLDGVSDASADTSASLPSGMSQIDIGAQFSDPNPFEPDCNVAFRLYGGAVASRDLTDFGDIMSGFTAYMSTPAGVAQSTSYANVGGTWTQVSATDFTFNTSTGVLTYSGATTKTFLLWVSMSGSFSATGALLTMAVEKNGTAITASEITRDVTSTAVGAWSCCTEVELATNDTLNLATKVDSGTPTFTISKCTMMVHEV